MAQELAIIAGYGDDPRSERYDTLREFTNNMYGLAHVHNIGALWNEGDYGAWYEQAEMQLDAINWPKQSVDILGYSLGGLLAMEYAAWHPGRVRKLGLLSLTSWGGPGSMRTSDSKAAVQFTPPSN